MNAQGKGGGGGKLIRGTCRALFLLGGVIITLIIGTAYSHTFKVIVRLRSQLDQIQQEGVMVSIDGPACMIVAMGHGHPCLMEGKKGQATALNVFIIIHVKYSI